MLVFSFGGVEELDAVAQIEASSFRSGWTREALWQDLQLSWSRLLVGRVFGEIVVFCNYWVVGDEIQILNVATHPAHRRRGYAAELLRYLIGSSGDISSLTLEVRRSNEAARALYARLGFETVGVRQKYYTDNQEDAILMTLSVQKT